MKIKAEVIGPNNIVVSIDDTDYLISYNTVICKLEHPRKVTLDSRKWDYSVTTSKHRNAFLNETKKETEKKIKSGEYFLDNLN
jgi:hypothetical protein